MEKATKQQRPRGGFYIGLPSKMIVDILGVRGYIQPLDENAAPK